MHESLQGLYDINTPGHFTSHHLPHIAINKFAGIPNHLHDTPTLVQDNQTILSSPANFFQPRSMILTAHKTLRANNIFGNSMQIPIVTATTQLYSINLNGINLDKKAVKFHDLCEEIKKSEIHLLAAAKHNLDTTNLCLGKSSRI
jgi:hypothetical protein